MQRKKKLLTCYVGLILFFGVTSVTATTPKSWKSGAYAYQAEGVSLREAIEHFSETFGVEYEIHRAVRGVLKGNLRSGTAEEFLDRLALEFNFNWFVYANKLYVSPSSDYSTIRLEVSHESAADLKKALTDIGLLDSRFGWGELRAEGIVLVSGPKKYLKMVRRLSKNRMKSDELTEVMVFPLKYANVSDRNIRYRHMEITIPGVKTILSNLFGTGKNIGQLNIYQPSDNLIQPSSNAQPYGSGSSYFGNLLDDRPNLSTNPSPGSPEALPSAAFESGPAKIEADVRNNFLLIRDNIKKRLMYQRLIDRLDVPSKMIEINAIIVDIDRSQLSDLGVEWEISNDGTSFGANARGTDPFLEADTAATLFIRNPNKFNADLRVLESKGEASVIANASVLTLENIPAVIDLSETVIVRATGERVARIEPITAGTSLRVIPHIISESPDRSILLEVDIEDGDVDTIARLDPTVNRSTISTQAVVNADRSLVFGGFHIDKLRDRKRKIPILGDIPFVGRLFSSSFSESSRRERLFILTPKEVNIPANPQGYVNPKDRQRIGAAIHETNKRHRSGLYYSSSEVTEAIEILVKGSVPAGFRQAGYPPRESASWCRTGSVKASFDSFESYVSSKFSVVIGSITNNTAEVVRFDEASCYSNRSLAVAVWPSASIMPGEKVEIFIALKPETHKNRVVRNPPLIPKRLEERSETLLEKYGKKSYE